VWEGREEELLPNSDKETPPLVVIFPGAEAGIKNPNNSTCRVIYPGLIGLRCQSKPKGRKKD